MTAVTDHNFMQNRHRAYQKHILKMLCGDIAHGADMQGHATITMRVLTKELRCQFFSSGRGICGAAAPEWIMTEQGRTVVCPRCAAMQTDVSVQHGERTSTCHVSYVKGRDTGLALLYDSPWSVERRRPRLPFR